MNWIDAFALISPIIVLAGVIGGYLSLRSAFARSEMEASTRIREALRDENELLQSRVNRLERDNRRLNRQIEMITLTLKKTQGIDIDMDDDMVILRDSNGSHIVHIDQPEQGAKP